MPKSNRWTIKRHVDQAIHHCARTIDYTSQAGMFFEDHDSNFFESFYRVTEALESCRKTLNNLQELL